jgi:hypothetical protein
VIVAVDMWLLVMAVAWIRSIGAEAGYRAALRFPVLVLLVLNALMSIGDGPWPWLILPPLVALLLAVPGWLVHVVWRWRHRASSSDASDICHEPAGLPGWW